MCSLKPTKEKYPVAQGLQNALLYFLKFLLETNMRPKSFLFRNNNNNKKKTKGSRVKKNKLDFIKI